MTLELKDLIYLGTYIFSLMGVLITIQAKLRNIEKENGQIRKIIFGDRGKLNIVDKETCKNNRDHIYMSIRRTEAVSEMLLKSIEEMKKHILMIMIHLQIRSPNGVVMEDTCKPKPEN